MRRKTLAQEDREKANIGQGPTAGISEDVVWELGERLYHCCSTGRQFDDGVQNGSEMNACRPDDRIASALACTISLPSDAGSEYVETRAPL